MVEDKPKNYVGLEERMWITAFLVLFSSASVSECRLSITSSTPSGTIMPSGEEFTLSCTTNLPWFLCIWEGPGGLACQCQTQEGGVSQMCLGDSRIHLSGGSRTCSMTISGVDVQDIGRYRCVLADRKIQMVAMNMDVEVGVKATVSWVSTRGRAGAHVGNNAFKGKETRVQEGDEIRMACKAIGGFPEPELEITGLGNIKKLERDVTMSSMVPGVNVVQTFSYRGREEDDGGVVTCTAVQKGIAGGILYTSQVETNLEVLPVPLVVITPPFPTTTDIIGIIVGSFLVILLCAAFLIYLLCCGSGKSKETNAQVVLGKSSKSKSIPTVVVTTDSSHQDGLEYCSENSNLLETQAAYQVPKRQESKNIGGKISQKTFAGYMNNSRNSHLDESGIRKENISKFQSQETNSLGATNLHVSNVSQLGMSDIGSKQIKIENSHDTELSDGGYNNNRVQESNLNNGGHGSTHILVEETLNKRSQTSTSIIKNTRSPANLRKTMQHGSVDQMTIDKYKMDMHQYTLNDCDTIDIKGKTYSDIIQEHLCHSPSITTLTNSVEVERCRHETAKSDFSATVVSNTGFHTTRI